MQQFTCIKTIDVRRKKTTMDKKTEIKEVPANLTCGRCTKNIEEPYANMKITMGIGKCPDYDWYFCSRECFFVGIKNLLTYEFNVLVFSCFDLDWVKDSEFE